MTFSQSIKTCMRKYATFEGRASRSEFWWFYLFFLLMFLGAGMIDEQLFRRPVTLFAVCPAFLLPCLAVGTRRFRDIDISMTFGQSIATCMRKYATFTGRASRSEFWWFYLFVLLMGCAALFIDVTLFRRPFTLFAVCPVFWLPCLAVGARRLHDTGKSGWWLLLYVILLIGVLLMQDRSYEKLGMFVFSCGPIPLLILWALPSTPTKNESDSLTPETEVQQTEQTAHQAGGQEDDNLGARLVAESLISAGLETGNQHMVKVGERRLAKIGLAKTETANQKAI